MAIELDEGEEDLANTSSAPLHVRRSNRSADEVFRAGGLVCYVLFSAKNPHRVYTGFTNNFARRLKEHNTSSKGARHTHDYRPYVPMFIVSGFTSRREANNFETCMKKNRCRKYTRGLRGRTATLMKNLRGKKWRTKSLTVICMLPESTLQPYCCPGDRKIAARFAFHSPMVSAVA